MDDFGHIKSVSHETCEWAKVSTAISAQCIFPRVPKSIEVNQLFLLANFPTGLMGQLLYPYVFQLLTLVHGIAIFTCTACPNWFQLLCKCGCVNISAAPPFLHVLLMTSSLWTTHSKNCSKKHLPLVAAWREWKMNRKKTSFICGYYPLIKG